MKPENRVFLDNNRHFYDTLIKAQYLKGLNAGEREGMQRIMGEEFQKGYQADLWCPVCVADMVRLVYRTYDAWLLANPDPFVEPEPVEPVSTTSHVKASFPSHKKHQRK